MPHLRPRGRISAPERGLSKNSTTFSFRQAQHTHQLLGSRQGADRLETSVICARGAAAPLALCARAGSSLYTHLRKSACAHSCSAAVDGLACALCTGCTVAATTQLLHTHGVRSCTEQPLILTESSCVGATVLSI